MFNATNTRADHHFQPTKLTSIVIVATGGRLHSLAEFARFQYKYFFTFVTGLNVHLEFTIYLFTISISRNLCDWYHYRPTFQTRLVGLIGSSLCRYDYGGSRRRGDVGLRTVRSSRFYTYNLSRSYEKEGQRITYSVNRIEIRRDTLSRLRCIVVAPPGGSGVKFYQKGKSFVASIKWEDRLTF